MKKTFILKVISLYFMMPVALKAQNEVNESSPNQAIFVYGGLSKPFVKYVTQLTGKSNPKICFLLKASGDNLNQTIDWHALCKGLPIDPYVQRIWVNYRSQKETSEEKLLEIDAIIARGGNTVNMLGLWKVQGIDTGLKKALKKGLGF